MLQKLLKYAWHMGSQVGFSMVRVLTLYKTNKLNPIEDNKLLYINSLSTSTRMHKEKNNPFTVTKSLVENDYIEDLSSIQFCALQKFTQKII